MYGERFKNEEGCKTPGGSDMEFVTSLFNGRVKQIPCNECR